MKPARVFLFSAVVAAVSAASPIARSNPLPNQCAIIATEANARLETSAVWSRVLFIEFIDFRSLSVCAHALTLWQIHKNGVVLDYDESGTHDLDTHSQALCDIVAALNKSNPSHPIINARFIQ